MIDYLIGKVVYSTENFFILDKDGIGLKIISPYKLEGEIKVFTKLFIKDEELILYGFKTREERDLFEKLTSVSGIGVKHAFSLLKNLSAEKIVQAIEDRDITVLSSVPGIGKKTAQRLIFELQGKIDFYENELLEDAVEALVNLGFEKKDAVNAVRNILKKEEVLDLKEIIRKSLIELSKGAGEK